LNKLIKNWNWKWHGIGILTIACFAMSIITLADKPVKTNTQPVTITAQPAYKIIATKSVAMFQTGMGLPNTNAAFFYKANPEISYTPSFHLTGAKSNRLQGTITTTIAIQALDENGLHYWTNQLHQIRTQANVQGNQFSSDEIVLRPAELYPTFERTNRQLNVLGAKGLLVVDSVLTLQGQVNQKPIIRTISQSFPIELGATAFKLPQSNPTETVQTLLSGNKSAPSGIFLRAYFPIGIGVLLLFLFGMLHWQSRGHRKYKRWISEGTISVQPHYVISISKLQDLVDLAIDLNNRVIFDRERKLYVVFSNEYMYRYKED
jgi:hypothetical protein